MNSVKSTNSLLAQSYVKWLSMRQQVYASTSTNRDEIRIPDYIPRSKTAILEALDSTVQQSPHVLPYGFFSDPRLTPKNSREFKNFALSKESGMKAAQYFMKNYPQLFYRDHAEPKIEKFSYPDVFNEQMEFNLEDIENSIEKRNVSNAIVAYKKLSEQNVDIPMHLKSRLFELVCFFNSKDAFEYVDELPFTRKITARLYESINSWDSDSFAEKMWTEIFSKENCENANSAYIQALVRFGAFDRAYEVFRNLEAAKKTIDLNAINSLIRALPFIATRKLEVRSVAEFLDLINLKSFTPSIETIDAAMFTLSFIRNSEPLEVINFTEKILLDCKLLNLQLSLGTYGFVLAIFYKNLEREKPNIIYKIIDRLEQKQIKVNSKQDLVFFDEAMRVASHYFSDSKLAIRIYDLFRKNSDVYLNVYREANIYENFFVALAKGESIEVLFDYYNKICPGLFFPTITIFESFIDHLIVFNSFEYIEKLFIELNKYSYFNLNSMCHKIFHLMVSAPRTEKTDLIFSEYLEKSLESFRRSQLAITDNKLMEKNIQMINSILDHLLFVDQELQVHDFLMDNALDLQMIEKRRSEKFLSKLVTKLIEHEHGTQAINILKFCVANEYGKLEDNLRDVLHRSKLTNNQKQIIKNLLLLC